jgi:predicted metalloprotease with PDZ domain
MRLDRSITRNENYTKLLWVAEGMTSYYEGLLLRRAGLITEQEFLSGKASAIESFRRNPADLKRASRSKHGTPGSSIIARTKTLLTTRFSYYDKAISSA